MLHNHPRKLSALLLACLALPLAFFATAPSASSLDPNPPKTVCVESVCVDVIEFNEPPQAYIYGVHEGDPIFTKSLFAVQGFVTIDACGDQAGLYVLLARDETAMNLNTTIGCTKVNYEQKLQALLVRVEPHWLDIEPIGEVVRARVQVRNHDNVIAFAPARSVRFYNIDSIDFGSTGDINALIQQFARDSTKPRA